jgi:hypothetical protein
MSASPLHERQQRVDSAIERLLFGTVAYVAQGTKYDERTRSIKLRRSEYQVLGRRTKSQELRTKYCALSTMCNASSAEPATHLHDVRSTRYGVPSTQYEGHPRLIVAVAVCFEKADGRQLPRSATRRPSSSAPNSLQSRHSLAPHCRGRSYFNRRLIENLPTTLVWRRCALYREAHRDESQTCPAVR